MFTGLVRTIILYLFIIVGIRLMGKRQVGELEPSELVMSLIIADLAAVPMQDYGIPLLTGLIPILALLALTMMLSVLTMRSVTIRTLLCGPEHHGGVPVFSRASVKDNCFHMTSFSAGAFPRTAVNTRNASPFVIIPDPGTILCF